MLFILNICICFTQTHLKIHDKIHDFKILIFILHADLLFNVIVMKQMTNTMTMFWLYLWFLWHANNPMT